MLSAVPSSGIVNSVIRITGIGDRDRPEWLIRISGIRNVINQGLNAGVSKPRLAALKPDTDQPAGLVFCLFLPPGIRPE
jgi:hypothetical protein